MFTIDKIKYHVHEQIIKTIDLCVKLQEVDTLEKWLKDCNYEIKRRESEKENTYPLFYEKAYLEMVLGNH